MPPVGPQTFFHGGLCKNFKVSGSDDDRVCVNHKDGECRTLPLKIDHIGSCTSWTDINYHLAKSLLENPNNNSHESIMRIVTNILPKVQLYGERDARYLLGKWSIAKNITRDMRRMFEIIYDGIPDDLNSSINLSRVSESYKNAVGNLNGTSFKRSEIKKIIGEFLIGCSINLSPRKLKLVIATFLGKEFNR